ncbi:DUF3180 family protein [Microbacterium radiodurans]|uniref:DUF3180 family protein n=1 Tax=Microbacterium radiodurans TaxID=661398 RepID=A0A5J5IWE2_9MICO|nr:DUF3180 family protein [Microbacterium radiodurans]KAA9089451.1 DUF3180 family protein [Microbacterium radiodurans]
MRRTSPAVLAATVAIGVGAGFVLDQALTGSGRPTFTPSIMLPVLYVMLGAAVVAAALPIRRAVRGGAVRVDPFRALRIAMLAQASSLVGAFTGGMGLGLLLFLLTRPVPPSLGSTGAVIAAVVGAVVLVVAGIVAEQLCTIRKDDDDDQPGPPEPDATPSHH